MKKQFPNKKTFITISLLATFFILTPRPTKAIVPPDIIFSIASQIGLIFATVFAVLSSLFFTGFQFIKMAIKGSKKIFVVVGSIILIISSLVLTYIVRDYYMEEAERRAYEKWISEADYKASTSTINSFTRQDQEYMNDNDQNESKDETEEWEDFAKNYFINMVAFVDDHSGIGIDREETFFWQQNKDYLEVISNEAFEKVYKSGRTDVLFLDIREDVEYEYGHMPDSIHIRLADLVSGEWQELPNNKFIYIICWSGIRGRVVSRFLRLKNIVSTSLVDGADGWTEYGGAWNGIIKFTDAYPDRRYSYLLDTKEIKKEVEKGSILVDVRSPERFKKYNLTGSFNIPLMYAPKDDLSNFFDVLPKSGKTITICDNYVNCFYARLVGIELEKRGYEFLGRYNKPWNY